jgi:hypothetical protein
LTVEVLVNVSPCFRIAASPRLDWPVANWHVKTERQKVWVRSVLTIETTALAMDWS